MLEIIKAVLRCYWYKDCTDCPYQEDQEQCENLPITLTTMISKLFNFEYIAKGSKWLNENKNKH